MSNEVVIKSNRYGVNLVMNEETPFPQLLQIVGEKFKETGSFFKNAKMAVSFEGRELSDKEKHLIVEAIEANSDIQIVSIMEQGNRQEEEMKRRVEAFREADRRGNSEAEEMQMISDVGDFYKFNLRSGQILECASNVTLVGDVNPGARIVAGGNIVVLGSLKGNACAGAAGDNGCFIFALDMRPIQLQIGEYIAKSPDKQKGSRRLFKKEKDGSDNDSASVAIVRNGNICIEPMRKGCLDGL